MHSHSAKQARQLLFYRHRGYYVTFYFLCLINMITGLDSSSNCEAISIN